MSTEYHPSVIVSRDGSLAVETSAPNGNHPVAGRDAFAITVDMRATPGGKLGKVGGIFNNWIDVDLIARTLGLPPEPEMALCLLEAAIGESLDQLGRPFIAKALQAPAVIEIGDDLIVRWRDRAPATDREVAQYFKRRLYHARQYDQRQTVFSTADMIRLHISSQTLSRVGELWHEKWWQMAATPPGLVVLSPTRELLREQQDLLDPSPESRVSPSATSPEMIDVPSGGGGRTRAPGKAAQSNKSKDKSIPDRLVSASDVYTLEMPPIGEGANGRVYLAHDEDDETFAVKILDPLKATTDKRKRFKNELLFGTQNRHDNIVRIVDSGAIVFGDGSSTPFYVMPLYQGSFRELMQNGRAKQKAVDYIHQLLEGLSAAHAQNVVHRDLKPENLLYDAANDRLIIADFGIARFSENELYTLVETAPKDRLANFRYAAPEQRRPGGQVDHRADLYAVGLMLNEIFTGTVPEGTQYRTIGERKPELTYLDPIVDRLLRQKRGERYQSADEVRKALLI